MTRFTKSRGQDSRYASSMKRHHFRRLEQLEDRRVMTSDLTAGLVGYWALDGIFLATVEDSAGANNGLIHGDVELTVGRLEGGLQFDGVGDYVSLGAAASLPNNGGRISISAWIAPQSTTGIRNIVAHGYSTSPRGEVFLRIHNGFYQVGSWDGVDHLVAAAVPSSDLGTWTHLVGTFDGGTWRLYRNGVLAAQSESVKGAVAVNENWAIGARGNGQARFFSGSIDEVRIYDRAIDEEEVGLLASQGGHSPSVENRSIVLSSTTPVGQALGGIAFTDVDGDDHTFTIVQDNLAAFAINPASGELSLANPQAFDFSSNDIYSVVVKVADANAPERYQLAMVYIVNADSFTIAGSSTVQQNGEYVLNLVAPSLPNLQWEIDWGDGQTQHVEPGVSSISHLYSTLGAINISAMAGDAVLLTALGATVAPNVVQYPGVNLLRNPSFEEPFLNQEGESDRKWDAYFSLAGAWFRDGATARIEVQAAGLFGDFRPKHGKQYLELDGDQDGFNGPARPGEKGKVKVYQELTVERGKSYLLSWWGGGRPGTVAAENNLKVSILSGGAELVAPTITGAWRREHGNNSLSSSTSRICQVSRVVS